MKKMLLLMLLWSTMVFAEENLLNDTSEIQEYIANFPMEQYEICHVPTLGRFYIDDIDDMVKNHLRQGHVWEQHIVNIFKKYIKPGSIAIDIGAHVGIHTITMAKLVGPDGIVVAFEPQKKIYRELIANCILNGLQSYVCAMRYAIGDKHDIVSMLPSVEGNEAGTPIGLGGDVVEMKTLDSICSNLQNISLIKLDAEGSEDIVLEGGRETILKNMPIIVIEICGGWNYLTAPDYIRSRINHTKEKLDQLGYNVDQIGYHDYLATPK